MQVTTSSPPGQRNHHDNRPPRDNLPPRGDNQHIPPRDYDGRLSREHDNRIRETHVQERPPRETHFHDNRTPRETMSEDHSSTREQIVHENRTPRESVSSQDNRNPPRDPPIDNRNREPMVNDGRNARDFVSHDSRPPREQIISHDNRNREHVSHNREHISHDNRNSREHNPHDNRNHRDRGVNDNRINRDQNSHDNRITREQGYDNRIPRDNNQLNRPPRDIDTRSPRDSHDVRIPRENHPDVRPTREPVNYDTRSMDSRTRDGLPHENRPRDHMPNDGRPPHAYGNPMPHPYPKQPNYAPYRHDNGPPHRPNMYNTMPRETHRSENSNRDYSRFEEPQYRQNNRHSQSKEQDTAPSDRSSKTSKTFVNSREDTRQLKEFSTNFNLSEDVTDRRSAGVPQVSQSQPPPDMQQISSVNSKPPNKKMPSPDQSAQPPPKMNPVPQTRVSTAPQMKVCLIEAYKFNIGCLI